MTKEPAASPRSPLLIVFLTVFVDLVGFGIVIPILPLYADAYHPSPLLFGLFMASFSLMQFVFSPILGRLSDRFGRRPVMLISLAGSCLSYVLFALAGNLTLLFASRILAGISGANISTAQAIIADTTPPEKRARGMGMIGAAFGLGFIFGPAIGGMSIGFGHAWPGILAASMSAVAFVLALTLLPETRNPSSLPLRRELRIDVLKRAFLHPLIGPVLAVYFLAIFAFANFESTFSQFLSWRFHSTPREVSLFFCYVGVLMVIVQGGLVGRLAKRFRETSLATWGVALTALGLVLLPILDARSGLFVLLALLALGTGLTNPSLSSLVSRLSDADEQGVMFGVFQSMGSLGRIGGPLSGQYLFGRISHASPYWFAASLLAVASLTMLSFGRRIAEGVRSAPAAPENSPAVAP